MSIWVKWDVTATIMGEVLSLFKNPSLETRKGNDVKSRLIIINYLKDISICDILGKSLLNAVFPHFITKFHMFCVPLYCIWVGLCTKEEALFPLGNCAMLRKRERVRAREGQREGGREGGREGRQNGEKI